MKTLKVLIKGIVQRVGYRSFVERLARKLKLKGYVKNLGDSEESVELVVQHPDQKVFEEFLKQINIKTELIDVQQIIRQDAEEKEFVKFEVIRASYEEENAERLDIAAYHLNGLTTEVRQMNKDLGNKMDDGFSKLGNKMDDGFSKLGNKMDAGFSGMGTKLDTISGKLDNVSGKLDNVSGKLDTVSDKLDVFHQDTVRKFDVLDAKYGKVSQNLAEISTDLKELIRVLKLFKPK